MSNPDEVPPRQQPGTQLPHAGNVPPAGSATPPLNRPEPEGYQAPPPGYGQEPGRAAPSGYSQTPGGAAPSGGFRFEMPADRPRNFNDVMPQGGFSGMFSVTGMPTELKVSYWVWLIGGILGLLGGVIGLFGSFVLFAFAPGVGLVVLLLVLVALTLAASQIVLAMKMKEGREWARFALTILAGASLLLSIVSAGAMDGRGSGWPGFIISLAATVLMWLPNSQAWFVSLRGRS
jgi:hypothetical protein